MCPECNGLGKKVGVADADFLDVSKSLNEGAVQVPCWLGWEAGAYKASGFFDNDKKLADFTPEEMDLLLYGKDRKFKAQFGDNAVNLTYLGIIEKIERSYVRRDITTYSERTQKAVAPYLRRQPCPLCHGARLDQGVNRAQFRRGRFPGYVHSLRRGFA
jgi:excinuclease UvrABC ATPase subunit